MNYNSKIISRRGKDFLKKILENISTVWNFLTHEIKAKIASKKLYALNMAATNHYDNFVSLFFLNKIEKK